MNKGWQAVAGLVLAIGMAGAAHAQDEPRFCPNRPDLGASGCTIEPGRVLVEMSGVDWEVDSDRDSRSDTILAGDLLIRTGIGDTTEVQFGWTPYGQVRTRDRATGVVDTVRGVGDIRLGLRQNLRNPDGSGLSYAVEPFVTLPVGREGVGAGDWSGGVVLPVAYELSERWDLNFTGEVAGAVDEDGDGRHLAYGGIVGLGYALSDQVWIVGELSLRREDDPMQPRTEAVAALSLAWQPRRGLQFDVLATAGLNRDTPDAQVQLGGAILF